MYVVADESHEVDDEKRPREARHPLILLREIEVDGEHDGHWHPTEVEQSGHDVGHGAVMQGKPLARNQCACGGGDTKERLFGVVQSFDIDRIDLIVGQEAHLAVDEAEEKPRQHVQREAAGGPDGHQHRKENGNKQAVHDEK